ncbi:hypothetical protein O9K63_07565 [Janibacter cremeus]|uniref:LysM peptidoglycan-binding domain-containing protein n=1 Tax=Janibacter cremeus TaxID=1285192 RepID=UPI0023F83BE1|nr:hypothetical protein [Janibacter cremeus]WEV79632.1 hypothetical protein O9K63_07565 [Janibacter cremeus]
MAMTRSRTALGLACLPGGLVVTAALGQSAVRLLESTSSRAGDPAAAVTGLAATGAALIAGWLSLCLALTLAAGLPGAVGDAARGLRDRVTPALVQRWAAVALGASVGATIAPGTAVAAVRTSEEPASSALPDPAFAPTPDPAFAPTPDPVLAATPDPGRQRTTATPAPGWLATTGGPTTPVTRSVADPGWVPSRPPRRHRTDPQLLTGRQRAGAEQHTVVVRRGDSLWSVAAAHLGPAATDVEIAREWPRWHEANHALIGDDPHVLLPGTQLTPPPAT